MLESNITGQPCPTESGRINQIDPGHAQRRGNVRLEKQKQGHFGTAQQSFVVDQSAAVKKEAVVNHSSVDNDNELGSLNFKLQDQSVDNQ